MEQTKSFDTTRRGSSFWAIILIAAGVMWLLGEANILSGANFAVLLRVWPLLLIGFGLHMLLGRQSPTLSLLIGGAMLLLIIGLMIVGPSIGLVQPLEATQERYSEPLGDASSARIELGIGVGEVNIRAGDTAFLFDADVRHVGEISYLTSEAEGVKTIRLRQEGSVTTTNLGLTFGSERELFWNVGLSARVPLDLMISGGVGENTIDLSGLQISNFNYNAGVGRNHITLPEGSYNSIISSGVGEVNITLNGLVVGELTIEGGVGGTMLDLPNDAPIRVQASTGLGGVNMPSFLRRVSGENDNGVWESESYASASPTERLSIRYSGGVGGLTVR